MPCLHLCRLEQLSERSKASNDPDTTESTVGGTLVCGISCEEQPVDNLTVQTLHGSALTQLTDAAPRSAGSCLIA